MGEVNGKTHAESKPPEAIARKKWRILILAAREFFGGVFV